MKIALDAMGGDLSPAEPVRGAILAARELDIEIILVGQPGLIQAELAKHARDPRLSILAASDSIGMEEGRIVQAVRQRPEASINVGIALLKEGRVDAFVSAGNTGAVMASAFVNLGRIPGIERPALGTLLPYNEGKVYILDVGANADCRPSHLVQFGLMGSLYSEKVVGIARPRVGLLNVGEEPVKGSELAQEAFAGLSKAGLNFIGNFEGVQVHKGVADVVVTDGFTGNIALKVGEGIADYILQQVRAVIKSSVLYAGAAILLKPALRSALKRLQYEEYGGANLLGIDGVVVIAHGRSDDIAIKNALKVAKATAGSGLIEAMRQSFARTPGVPAGG